MSFPSLAHVIKAVSEPLLFKSVKTLSTQKQRFPSPVEEMKNGKKRRYTMGKIFDNMLFPSSKNPHS